MLLYPVHKRQSPTKLHEATTARPAPRQAVQAMQATPAAEPAQEDDRVVRAFRRALKEAQRWKSEYDVVKAALADMAEQNASLRHAHAAPKAASAPPDELQALRSRYAALKTHARAKERDLAHARQQLEALHGLQRDLKAARDQLRASQSQAKELQAAREKATDKLQRLKGLRTELDAAKGRLADVQRVETEAANARREAQELALSRTQLQTAQQRTRECLQKAQSDLARSADMLAKADEVLQICACVHENTPLAEALGESRKGIATFLAGVRA